MRGGEGDTANAVLHLALHQAPSVDDSPNAIAVNVLLVDPSSPQHGP